MNIFSSKGRINRTQFLIWTLAILAVVAGLFFVLEWNAEWFAGALGEGLISLLMSNQLEGVLFVAIFFAINLPSMFRRLHDVNQSSWPYWVSMWIPGGYIIALIYLLIRKGTHGANQFGEEPRFTFDSIKKPAFIDGVGQKTQASADRPRTEKPIKVTRSDSDVFFQAALEELEADRADKALWAKIFAQTGGDENQAKALYIKTRADELGAQDIEQKAELLRVEKAKAEEKKRELRRKEDVKRFINDLEAALRRGAYVRASAMAKELAKLDPENELLTSEKVCNLPRLVEIEKNQTVLSRMLVAFKNQGIPLFSFSAWEACVDEFLKKIPTLFQVLPDEDISAFKKKVNVVRENGVKRIKRNRRIAAVGLPLIVVIFMGLVISDRMTLNRRIEAFGLAIEHRDLGAARVLAEKVGSRYKTHNSIIRLEKYYSEKDKVDRLVDKYQAFFEKYGGDDWDEVNKTMEMAALPVTPPLEAIALYQAVYGSLHDLRQKIDDLNAAEAVFLKKWEKFDDFIKKYNQSSHETFRQRAEQIRTLVDPVFAREQWELLRVDFKNMMASFEYSLEFDEADLVQNAVSGDIFAVNFLFEKGMWNFSEELDVEQLKQWSTSAERIGRRTIRQIYSIALANLATRRQNDQEAVDSINQALALLESDPVKDWLVFHECAWLHRELGQFFQFEISEGMTSIFDSQKPTEDKIFELGNWYFCYAELMRPDHNQKGDWGEAAQRFNRAFDCWCKSGGYHPWADTALMQQAYCLRPDNNPEGDWSQSGQLYAQAAELNGALGDKAAQSSMLYLQARCQRPDNNPEGSWDEAIAIYVKVRELRQSVGDKPGLARVLSSQAHCFRPDVNPQGDWAKAARLYALEARISEELGNHARQTEALSWQAYCVNPKNNPDGNWVLAGELYGSVADLKGANGDLKGQAEALYNKAVCVRPDNNEKGDWSVASEAYRLSSELRAEVGDLDRQAASLYYQAWCLDPDNNPNGNWNLAEENYRKAAELFGQVDNKSFRASALLKLAYCCRPGKSEQGSWAKAATIYADVVSLRRELDDQAGVLDALWSQAAFFQRAEEWGVACALYEELVELARDADDKKKLAFALYGQANCFDARSHAENRKRAHLYWAASQLFKENGDRERSEAARKEELLTRRKY